MKGRKRRPCKCTTRRVIPYLSVLIKEMVSEGAFSLITFTLTTIKTLTVCLAERMSRSERRLFSQTIVE